MRITTAAMTCALLPVAALGQGQPSASVPATAPTHSVSNLPSARPAATTLKTGPTAVTWSNPTLTIRASGEGLPAVLRQVAHATGMKITGGVPDEPVFGSYGPGPVQEVMAALFDGLSVNMLLINGTFTQPKELVLTARTGGATPPQPSQNVTVDTFQLNPADANLAQPRPGRHTSPESFKPIPLPMPDAASQNLPTFAPGAGPAVPLNDPGNTTGSSAPATDANGTPQSPNGVRTPEQIFEELRKRQQQSTTQQ